MNRRNLQLIYLFSSIIFLIIGFLCYFLFRDNSNLLFFQMTKLNIFPGHKIILPDNIISYFVKYNLCDGLWLLSGILFFRFIWFNNSKIGQYYIIVFIFIALLYQFLQILEYIPGTFDIMDIITMAIFALLEQLIYIHNMQRRKQWGKIG